MGKPQKPPVEQPPVTGAPPVGYPSDSMFAKILGPLATVSSVRAMGGDPQQWVDKFRAKEPAHYASGVANGANYWSASNYYDRARTYYAWHAAEDDAAKAAEYLSKGHELALNYRNNYAPTGGVSAHWSMPVGVALHHILTGDAASRTWVLNVANNFNVSYYRDNLDNSNGEMDNRVQARCLEAWLLAWTFTGDSKWSTLLRNGLTDILSIQDADGAWRLHNTEQNGENKPFMVGLLNDAMILYGRLLEKDTRIEDSIRSSCEYMWSNNWLPDEQTFLYQEGPDPDEPPSHDLNNLIINGFTACSMHEEAKQIFAGSMLAWIDGQKQFNQQYLQSPHHLAKQPGAVSAWEGAEPIPPEPIPEPDVDVEAAKTALNYAQAALLEATSYVDAALTALGGDAVAVRKRRDKKHPEPVSRKQSRK